MSIIIIGSFNMYKFRAFESNDHSRKDIDRIAQIIRDARFDIIALQEVFNEQAVKSIAKTLGGSWRYSWESPPSRSAIAAEGYAFLWNTRRFDIPNYGGSEKWPRIYNQYRLEPSSGQRPLIRNPYYGRFVPTFMDMPFEIRIINAHILFSKYNDESSEEMRCEPSALMMRRNEFIVLASTLYPKIADRVYGNNHPQYTVLLGDYNLNLRKSSAVGSYLTSLGKSEVIMIYDGNNIKEIETIQEELTTLKSPPADPQEPDYTSATCWANNYDHFTLDRVRFNGVEIKASRVDSLSYCSNYRDHRKTVSDHAPIKLEIDLRNGY